MKCLSYIRSSAFKNQVYRSWNIIRTRVRVMWNGTKRLWILEEYVYFPIAYKYACGPNVFRGAENRRHFFSFDRAPDRWLKARSLLLFQLREYTLTESYHEDDVEVEFVSNDNLQANSEAPRGIDPNRDLNEAIAEERREMDTQRYRYVSIQPTFFILLPLLPSSNFLLRIFRTIGSGKLPWIWQLNSKIKKQPFFASFLGTYIFDRIVWFIQIRMCQSSQKVQSKN